MSVIATSLPYGNPPIWIGRKRGPTYPLKAEHLKERDGYTKRCQCSNKETCGHQWWRTQKETL